ncbi:substrate-binding periplasmic protein [Pseudomonas benzenivorans]|uniref:substrate-binding periplasmic protein n=1 Tax=Pseudomonas benzenivorans TaxID=556533 RepID=UPI0035166B10
MATPYRSLIGLFLACLLGAQSQAELRLLTEDAPPMSFIQDGQLTGMSVDIVEALIQRTGQAARVDLVPWTRGYQMAQQQANTALFSTVRTPEREALFQWVGPLIRGKTRFYSLRTGGLQIDSLEQAGRSGPLAVPKHWYTHETLLARGLQNVYGVPGPKQMVTMLKHGRVKLIATEDITLRDELSSGGLTPEEVQPHMVLMQSDYYIAFSPQTDPLVVDQWQLQLEAMRQDGSLQRIVRRWLPHAEAP